MPMHKQLYNKYINIIDNSKNLLLTSFLEQIEELRLSQVREGF
jgi:hypothetical protein